jgi:hypothetical protein
MREQTTPQEPLELSLIYPVESTQISSIEMVLILSKANSEVYNLNIEKIFILGLCSHLLHGDQKNEVGIRIL